MQTNSSIHELSVQQTSPLYPEKDVFSLLETSCEFQQTATKKIASIAIEAIGETKLFPQSQGTLFKPEPKSSQHENIRQMAHQLGYLPLAITHMIQYIEENNIPFSTYHALFNEYEAKLFHEKGLFITPEESSILTTWLIAIERGGKKGGEELDQELITRISCLGQGLIPVTLLYKWMSLFSDKITESMINQSLQRLEAYALIISSSASSKDELYYTISPRIQQFINNRLTIEDDKQHVSELILLLEQKLSAFKETNEEKRSLLLGYLDQANMVVMSDIVRKEVSLERKASFIVHLSDLYYKLCFFNDALKYRKEGLKIERELYGEYSLFVAESYQAIGRILKDLWRPEESLKMSEKAIDIYQKVSGEHSLPVIETYQEMSKALANLGRLEEAFNIREKTLKLSLSIGEIKNHHLATSYLQIGKSLAGMGKREEALKMQEMALQINQNVLGEESRYTAESYDGIARVLSGLGRREEALKMSEKALQIHQKVLGEYSRYTAESYETVGYILHKLKRWDEALKMSEQSLHIKQTVLGEHSCYTAESYEAVGEALSCLKRSEEGLKMCEHALQIKRNIKGEYSIYTATSYHFIADVLNSLGRHEEALKMQEKALNIHQYVRGEDSIYTAESYHFIGQTLIRLGKKEEGFKRCYHAVQIYQKILGKDSPVALASYRRLETMKRESWATTGIMWMKDGLKSFFHK
ncbi:MAG: tetratricopeptide repeat protein [Candidatus Rhabdochlamydia sp.]